MEKCENHSAHEVLLKGLKGEIDGVKLSVSRIGDVQGEMATELALVTDKVDGMGHIAEAVLRLSIAVENSNTTLAGIIPIVTGHGTAIEEIKNAPNKLAFEAVKRVFLWAMGIVGLLLLGRFGLGGM